MSVHQGARNVSGPETGACRWLLCVFARLGPCGNVGEGVDQPMGVPSSCSALLKGDRGEGAWCCESERPHTGHVYVRAGLTGPGEGLWALMCVRVAESGVGYLNSDVFLVPSREQETG